MHSNKLGRHSEAGGPNVDIPTWVRYSSVGKDPNARYTKIGRTMPKERLPAGMRDGGDSIFHLNERGLLEKGFLILERINRVNYAVASGDRGYGRRYSLEEFRESQAKCAFERHFQDPMFNGLVPFVYRLRCRMSDRSFRGISEVDVAWKDPSIVDILEKGLYSCSFPLRICGS